MRICRFWEPRLGPRLGLVVEEEVIDLTAMDPRGCADISAWLKLADPAEHIRRLAETARKNGPRIRMRELDRKPAATTRHLLAPIDTQEVWAAGVMYEPSRDTRVEESRGGGGFYGQVYEAARPQLVFKAMPHRVAGPNAPIRVRSDSEWTLPEPELAVVFTPELQVAGYTCGDDVSSRDIEGENPLYLQQAKTYVGCCALGPVIVLPDEFPNPDDTTISMVVIRDGMTIFQGETSTSCMRRRISDLVPYLGRDNAFPDGVVLLTGTGVVPPDDCALEADDVVEIIIDGVGLLRNPVARTSRE